MKRPMWGAAAALALACAGCNAGQARHVYQSAEVEGRLVLRWTHLWEPLQVIVHRPGTGRFEELTLVLTGVPIGEIVTVESEKATGRYDHGRLHPCDTNHLVKGTVKLLRRTDKDERAQLDVLLICPGEPRFRLDGVYDFEIKPHLPEW